MIKTKTIEGFSNYIIDNLGNVTNTKTGRILKQNSGKNDNKFVILSNGKLKKTLYIKSFLKNNFEKQQYLKVQPNVKLSKVGRKDNPVEKGYYYQYENFPIGKLKPGYSFNTGIDYEYGKTITIKNTCRNKARNLGMKMQFAVREWKGKIRVWRTK